MREVDYITQHITSQHNINEQLPLGYIFINRIIWIYNIQFWKRQKKNVHSTNQFTRIHTSATIETLESNRTKKKHLIINWTARNWTALFFASLLLLPAAIVSYTLSFQLYMVIITIYIVCLYEMFDWIQSHSVDIVVAVFIFTPPMDNWFEFILNFTLKFLMESELMSQKEEEEEKSKSSS